MHFFGNEKKGTTIFVMYRKDFSHKAPTEDETAYWTYYFYQAENDAKRLLKDNKTLDIFHSSITSRKSIHIKALERVALWRYVLHYNIFTS